MPLYSPCGNTVQVPDENKLPLGQFTLPVSAGTVRAMHERPIYVLRWRNFRALIGEKSGAVTAAAERLGKSQSQVSQFGGKTPMKNIGDDIATEIERIWAKPLGWLDQDWREGTVNKSSDLMRAGSRFGDLDAANLSRALYWLDAEERAKGPLQAVRRAERLMALYELVEAGGGDLSPADTDELIASLSQGVENGGPRKVGRWG